MITGTAAATFPTSSSPCMIFLIRACTSSQLSNQQASFISRMQITSSSKIRNADAAQWLSASTSNKVSQHQTNIIIKLWSNTSRWYFFSQMSCCVPTNYGHFAYWTFRLLPGQFAYTTDCSFCQQDCQNKIRCVTQYLIGHRRTVQ